MASRSESGSSISVTNSNIGFINTGSGNVTTGPVIVNSSPVDEFPLPQRIKTFHGREDKMRELDEVFFNHHKNKAVICGLGGFGKTELSKQFAQRCVESGKVQRVVFIASENPNELQKSFTKLKPIYDSCTDQLLLIIFDNCVNQKSITDYAPSGNKNHRILITSQYKQWQSDVTVVELQPLSSDSAMEIFKSVLRNKYRVEDAHLYETLAHLVGYIPLGLQVVAAYIEQEDEDFNLTEYVSEIENSTDIIDEVISDCAENSYDKSMYGAMITSLNKIKNKGDQKPKIQELAHDVLCFSAYLSADLIYPNDLLSLVNMVNKKYKNNEFKLAIKLLLNFSFVQYGCDDKKYLVQHRTIQLFVRHYLCKSDPQCKYYKECLQWALKEDFCRNLSVILSHADSNIKIVHDVYRENNMNKNIGVFLNELIKSECIKCIIKIFENPDEQTKKRIYQDNLLATCAPTNKINILKVFLPHVNINAKCYKGTILHVFAEHLNLEGIKLLIENGADVNASLYDLPLFKYICRRLIQKYGFS